MRPTWPSSPMVLATEGCRRSASTRSTREPPWAMASARLMAVRVLPSPGIEEVTTNECRPPVVTSTNWRLVRSRRYSSAATLWGLDSTTRGAVSAFLMRRSAASTGRLDATRRSASVRIRVSRDWRSRASPIPSARPASTPRARFRIRFGLVGFPGGEAAWMVVDSTRCPALARSGEKSPPMLASSGPAAFAMSAASCPVGAVARIVRTFVSAEVAPDTLNGVPGSMPTSSRSGSSTTGDWSSSR